ncbi:hypothetical protein [Lyngbya confervoides]|uniref:Uncharacterized protein n=1 Tax=Lyngbya confervoides BDU141951 TaxID=1574623 RepID=A0ABD4T7W6_9CYAN|nr:hypothetical protein [Lyngbya confervoides]MCM1984568.1 hypothetical protein [Lyngbya confervoides BDU141951]
MDYLYHLGKLSLVLRVIYHLKHHALPIRFITVLHQLDGWVVRIKTGLLWDQGSLDNLQAFLLEVGVPYRPSSTMISLLESLEQGQSPTMVMNRYHIPVIVHGKPDAEEIHVFEAELIQGLGYRPETLA